MKKILSLVIFLFLSSSLFSQYGIDYEEFGKIILPKSLRLETKIIKEITEENNKENEVKELLNLNSKIKRLTTNYKGDKINTECRTYYKSYDFYLKLFKKTEDGLKDDKREIARATTNYGKKLYTTRYNYGVKHLNEYRDEVNYYAKKINSCNDKADRKRKLLVNELIEKSKGYAEYYLSESNLRKLTPKVSSTTYNIEDDDLMHWNTGTIDDLINKAKNSKTIAFAFICNPEKEICQKTYNDVFKASSSEVNSWSRSDGYKIADLHNKNFISGKFYSKNVLSFMNENNITHYPTFIWFSKDGSIIQKETGVDTDVYNISKKLVDNQFSEITNFEENLKKKGCKDIFCEYKEIHRIFIKTPNSRRNNKLFDIIKYNPGSLNSPELQWLLNHSDFEELSSDEKMSTFYSALEFSYMKETEDYELTDAFNSYATDEKIKPLGKYAKTFREYLIKDEEGLGFKTTTTSDKYPVYKKYDNGNYKYKGFRTKRLKFPIGKWVKYYESGAIKEEYELDEDSRHIGKYNTYYENGKIFEVCEDIKEPKYEKCIQYHKNGKIRAEGKRSFWDNELNDKWKHYYDSGELQSVGYYKASLKVGLWIEYHKNGNVKAKGNYTTYVGGTKNDKWEYYNENGKKNRIEEHNYQNKTYKRTHLYPNRTVRYIYIYENDKLSRIRESYSPDGKQTLVNGTGIYKVYNQDTNKLEHTSEMKNGIRNGIANWYYKNGQLKLSVLYKYSEKGDFGGLRWEVLSMFDIDGNSLEKGTLKDGNGTWKTYDKNGKLESIKSYTNGIENPK